MKKYIGIIPALLLLVLPFSASAHEHASFEIKGSTYNFVVGSLNEPIAVDDKTGLELIVTKGAGHATMGPDGDMDGPIAGVTPVKGLEDTLKVELIAGSAKKTLDIAPAYGKEGSYTAKFYPTMATSFSYRLVGTIEGSPVDLTFTCLPDGKKAEDDTTRKELGNGITQTVRGGGFSCPVAKESLGFPEKSTSIVDMTTRTASADSKSTIALVLAAIGIVLAGAVALRRKK